MDNDESTIRSTRPDADHVSEVRDDVDTVVEIVDQDAMPEAAEDTNPGDRPVSTTIGTGSFFGIGCTIFALLFVCVGVAIFMWRQVN